MRCCDCDILPQPVITPGKCGWSSEKRGKIMDTVLVGGFVFLVAAGAIFLAIDKVGKSEMRDRKKRLLTYALLGGLIVLTIGIFHWHRAVWLAERGIG